VLRFARLLAERGHECALTARRADRLTSLADAIAAAGHKRPHVIALDLAARDGPSRLAGELAARGLEPAIVVNNAGFGLRGPAADLDRAEQIAMIDLNVRALTALSLMFVDSLKRHGGGLINVASLSGFFQARAWRSISPARLTSALSARHSCTSWPGKRCVSPASALAQCRPSSGAADCDQSQLFLTRSAEQIAREGYDAFMRGQRVVVPGIPNKIAGALPRFMPRALVLRAVERFLKRAGPPIT
jgi:short-subunit dehydrogenase